MCNCRCSSHSEESGQDFSPREGWPATEFTLQDAEPCRRLCGTSNRVRPDQGWAAWWVPGAISMILATFLQGLKYITMVSRTRSHTVFHCSFPTALGRGDFWGRAHRDDMVRSYTMRHWLWLVHPKPCCRTRIRIRTNLRTVLGSAQPWGWLEVYGRTNEGLSSWEVGWNWGSAP